MDLAAGEVPDEPAVHRAAAKLPGLRPAPQARHHVQKPAELRAGEVSVQQQSRLFRHRLLQPVGPEPVTDGRRPAALPDDGVIDRLPRPGVPHHGGLPLVGDADGSDALGIDMGGVHRLGHRLALRGPDLHRVMLHPAGLGVDLPEGPLGPGDDTACAVE